MIFGFSPAAIPAAGQCRLGPGLNWLNTCHSRLNIVLSFLPPVPAGVRDAREHTRRLSAPRAMTSRSASPQDDRSDGRASAEPDARPAPAVKKRKAEDDDVDMGEGEVKDEKEEVDDEDGDGDEETGGERRKARANDEDDEDDEEEGDEDDEDDDEEDEEDEEEEEDDRRSRKVSFAAHVRVTGDLTRIAPAKVQEGQEEQVPVPRCRGRGR